MDERSIRDITLCELFAYNILVHVMAYTRLNRTKLLLLLLIITTLELQLTTKQRTGKNGLEGLFKDEVLERRRNRHSAL